MCRIVEAILGGLLLMLDFWVTFKSKLVVIFWSATLIGSISERHIRDFLWTVTLCERLYHRDVFVDFEQGRGQRQTCVLRVNQYILVCSWSVARNYWHAMAGDLCVTQTKALTWWCHFRRSPPLLYSTILVVNDHDIDVEVHASVSRNLVVWGFSSEALLNLEASLTGNELCQLLCTRPFRHRVS